MEAATADAEQRLRVGCALLPKKQARYLTPRMREVAADKGVELCVIDVKRPIGEQGPFDAIIHKLRPNRQWEQDLANYLLEHPSVKVIDKMDSIRTLQNRATMLQPLHGSGIVVRAPAEEGQDGAPVCSCATARVQAPPQVTVPEGMAPSEVQRLLDEAGLQPPLLVKPLWSDGREGSHGLAVLHDLPSLGRLLQEDSAVSELRPPLVVQQYVEHGGILFKVYVVGLTTVVTQRPSLGDKHMGGEGGKRRKAGVTNLPRISCLRPGNDHAAATAAPGVPPPQQQQQAPACQMPPGWMTDGLAAVLRKRLGMQLFNFDLICPDGNCSGPGPVPCGAEQESRYYIIDINYFPGVDKIPGFEQIFVDFLAAACAAKRNGATGAGGDSLPAAAGSSPPTPHPSSPPQPGPSLLVQPPAGSAW